MYVKAAVGLVVRDPVFLDLLPPEGRDVPETDYWQRRLLHGDVVLATPPAQQAAQVDAPAKAAD